MLIALAPPALPGLAGQLPSAPARRQDSSGSSGSYHTAPGSPEPPDVGPDAEGRAHWPRAAPALGVGEQLRLSISAQNSRQQLQPGSGFPRGPGCGPRPPQPQLRMLPSGEMEVIFGPGALFCPSDPDPAADAEVQQLTARASHGRSPPASPAPAAPQPQPQPQPPDGGSRWATYLELWPRGPSPAAPASPAQFECVEVALEERAQPARPRTVPKRQIELRARPRSPPREAEAGSARPRPLLRTGSLDESLGRLQAAAGLVQTALARRLGPAAPAPSGATFRPAERPEPETPKPARGGPRADPEDGRSRPPRGHHGSAPARAPRPWPSLRERAIRRDKPAPGTEPLGPVSSSVFLQPGEKAQDAPSPDLAARCPGETPGRTVPRPFESRDPREVASKAARPRSPSPRGQAPNGAPPSALCPPPRSLSPRTLSPRNRATPRVSGPCSPRESSAWEKQDPSVEEAVGRRSPSPPTPSRWNPGAAAAAAAAEAGSPPAAAPSRWEAQHPAVGAARPGDRSPSPPAWSSWEAPGRPTGPWSPSPRMQGSSIVSPLEALNGVAQGEPAPPAPPAPRTPEPAEAQSPSTRGVPDLAFPDRQPLPLGRLSGPVDSDAPPEALAGPGRPRVAIPRPRDLRKMVKTTYAPSFAAGTPGSGPPAPPADPAEPRPEEAGAPETPELRALGTPAPAHYTSVYLRDFLPVVSHPYEPPEPPPHADPRDAPQPNGAVRRRAENSTAKPFARAEIRLPGAAAPGHGRKEPRGAAGRGPGDENRAVEAQRPASDGEGPSSPLGGAPSLPRRPSVGPAGAHPPGPSRPSSPRAHPSSSPGRAPKLETPPPPPPPPPPAPEPAPAVQPPHPREPPAPAGRTAAPQPRAASAPPLDRPPGGPSPGARRPAGAANPGKVLVDPESGRCYLVEAPRQPRLRLLFDPESGQYVEVLLPPSPPGPPRRLYTPLALSPGLYPPAYGPLPGLSLPPSPGPPAYGGAQLPWAPEAGPPERMYYLPVGGTPGPAPPLLLCAPPAGVGPAQAGKSSLFPA